MPLTKPRHGYQNKSSDMTKNPLSVRPEKLTKFPSKLSFAIIIFPPILCQSFREFGKIITVQNKIDTVQNILPSKFFILYSSHLLIPCTYKNLFGIKKDILHIFISRYSMNDFPFLCIQKHFQLALFSENGIYLFHPPIPGLRL